MRKLIVQELVSIDGFFAGPNGEIDWHLVDDEYGEYAKDFLNSLDILLFGRATYQLMVSYWPTETNDFADIMNSIPKIVISKTLEKVDWQNTRLVNENIVEEITQIKQESGKDLAILGSADLASSLLNAGLIDEYQITVVPVVLGDGKPLFKDMHDRVNMKLLKSRVLHSGCIQLHYQPDGAE
ncbi:dihydrofolate reductase family protein [Cohnella silvisoli]|uniref:Dihydrofolate reductase family protein n=1 Tax=Cohnella silvisoli TaxID=2873699 RepID=A0ABV1KTY3_9BACL|nr:dihydrofolate reductase family protein [Cohnella silvisoli]MCD9022628.1 dihydrofolate reductase family protein [Cohnella silvisoli]